MKNKTANALIYRKMPDGGNVDYNRILDATDREFFGKKMVDKNAERFLYQYADAMRNQDMVEDRIECIGKGLEYDQKRYTKDPSRRYEDLLDGKDEVPMLKKTLEVTKNELSDARVSLADVICFLEEEDQKLVMVSHYICGAEWRRISCVCGHQDRWAKEIHDKAVEAIRKRIKFMERLESRKQDDGRSVSGYEKERMERPHKLMAELARLEMEWKNKEHEWKMNERNKTRIPDDINLVFGILKE